MRIVRLEFAVNGGDEFNYAECATDVSNVRSLGLIEYYLADQLGKNGLHGRVFVVLEVLFTMCGFRKVEIRCGSTPDPGAGRSRRASQGGGMTARVARMRACRHSGQR